MIEGEPIHVAAEVLVVRLAALGDEAAFAELVRRHQTRARGLMRYLCGDSALADDLAQQAFLRAWQDLAGLRDPKRFAPWFRQLSVNVWRKHLRRHDPLRGAEAVATERSQTTTPDLGLDLDRALARLEPDPRLCVVLSLGEGMSHGEIAAATELPVGTVKSHLRRSLKRLQAHLDAYAPEYDAPESDESASVARKYSDPTHENNEGDRP